MPNISHSRMELWHKCHYAYRLTYVDKVPRPPSAQLVFGRAIHEAIAHDANRRACGVRHTPTQTSLQAVADFQRALVADLAQWDATGVLRDDEAWRQRTGRRAVAVLGAYAETVAPNLYPATPKAVEYEFHIPYSLGLAPDAMWMFNGRVDVRTAPPAELGRERTIVDFKTGKPWDRGKEHSAEQATAYLWAERQRDEVVRGEESPARRVTFIGLWDETQDDGTITASARYRTTTRTQSQVDRYLSRVDATIEGITTARETGEFAATPTALCGYCDVLGHCEVGRAWLAQRGRPSHVPGVVVDSIAVPIGGS